ncbi:MAG: DUF6089 family protein [Rufibacter sp.]
MLAQQQERSTSELGIGIGGIVYKGEIAPRYRFLSNQPALTVFYKKDMSKALTLRGSLLAGRVIAEDEQYAERHPLAEFRKATVNTSLLELAAGIDYNFLDYYDFRRRIRWTPYFTLGVAGLVYNNKTIAENPDIIYPGNNGNNAAYRTAFAFSVPIGVGAKYAISHRWNIGIEFGARMLFTDEFDNLSLQNERVMNQYERDWYFYNGVSVSYTFYRLNCPAF